MPPPFILASDIDNTLTGDPAALRDLRARIARLRERRQLVLFLSTGRRIDEVVGGFRGEGLPEPDAVIGQVGTEIFLPPFSPDMPPLPAWERRLHVSYHRARALEFLAGIDGLAMQPDEYNTPLKASCFLDGAPDPPRAAEAIARRVAAAPDGEHYQVVWSSGRHLDVLPAAAGKGRAIRFLIGLLDLAGRPVVVAGDSGNDWSMFAEFGRGIVVANAQPELRAQARAAADGKDFYFAAAPYAAGVAEGLAYFGLTDGHGTPSAGGADAARSGHEEPPAADDAPHPPQERTADC